ncbi:MAG: 30S ribosomal protein S5 [Phycisphaeraceae bacterium]|nr:30S ribosomal protein S5 [Phycisphaeraceae bacterium]
MHAPIAESDGLEPTTVKIFRTATVVKGGRRFSFGALVVVGDRAGHVGMGYAKAPGVPAAIEKAQKAARKKLVDVALEGGTLPHPVTASYSASSVRLLPAAPGTGVIAGATVRAVLELAGVRDCLTKAYGSTNQKNLCKAALLGLGSLRSRAQIEQLRGRGLDQTTVEQTIELGKKYAPVSTSPVARPAPKRQAPPTDRKPHKSKSQHKPDKAPAAEKPADASAPAENPQTPPAPAAE